MFEIDGSIFLFSVEYIFLGVFVFMSICVSFGIGDFVCGDL